MVDDVARGLFPVRRWGANLDIVLAVGVGAQIGVVSS